MTFERRLVVVIAGLCAALAGCADFSRGDATAVSDGASPSAADGSDSVPDGGATDGVGSFFAQSVEPLLLSACQRCHSDGGEAADSQFLLKGDDTADFLAAARLVDASAPSSSRLLSKMSGNGHGGGTVFAAGSPEYQTVLRWIQQGALP